MEELIRGIIETNLDENELYDAVVEAVKDRLDYSAIAEEIVDKVDLFQIILEVASSLWEE